MSGAIKRISGRIIDLAELFKRVRPENKPQFDAFNAKCQQYTKTLTERLPEAPKIDWDYYAANVKPEMKAMVEQFKSSYEAYKVPVPIDTQTAEIDQFTLLAQKEIDQFKMDSQERICAYQAEIETLKALLPFDQMTMEDFIDAYPSHGPDFLNRPTFWPHGAEDQPDPNASDLLPGEAHLLQQVIALRQRLAKNIRNEQKVVGGDLAWKPY